MPSEEELLALVHNWLADCQLIEPQNEQELPYYIYPVEYSDQIFDQLKLWDGYHIKWHLFFLLKALEQMLDVSWYEDSSPLHVCTEPGIYQDIVKFTTPIQKRI